MILINLLPHREVALKRKRQAFFATLGGSVVLGLVFAGLIWSFYQAQISNQQDRNAFLKAELVKLDVQIKDIAALQQEITALRARQTAVEDLQADRNLPVHLLDELVRQLPDGIYLTSARQDAQTVLITGVAQSNERVSELLRNLGGNSPWLSKPELIEITGASLALSQRDSRRVANFSMRMALKRAKDTPVGGVPVPSSAASSAKT
ncbi:MAG: PilN domain-containing protein [Pseudomonadota bacterium]